MGKEQKKEVEDILLERSSDRRILNYVPAKDGVRTNVDRRQDEDAGEAEDFEKLENSIYEGIRYAVDYPVTVTYRSKGRKRTFQAKAVNISGTGIQLKLFKEDGERLNEADDIQLKFEILPGTMPEGYEMPVNIHAQVTKNFAELEGYVRCGLRFKESLAEYSNKHRGRYMFMISAFWLFMVSLVVILMRSEVFCISNLISSYTYIVLLLPFFYLVVMLLPCFISRCLLIPNLLRE